MNEIPRSAAVLALIERLYPICRSITGDGVRETLRIVSEYIPLQVHEVPTGTSVFDWQVPLEWNIRDAWIKSSSGEKIVDFQQLNLHVLNYSEPVHKQIGLAELRDHLFTLPNQPDWVPYRTSYHDRNWGFCMTHRRFLELQEDKYEVFIDASLSVGALTYGEFFIPGRSTEEVLFITHVCHPSLCNDNLSGIAVATFLAKELAQRSLRYSYRVLFLPATIGAITWLSLNRENVEKVTHGLVLSLLGDREKFHYKESRNGKAAIDRLVPRVLRDRGDPFEIMKFYPYGYDERQFCSPGMDLPIGRLTRSVHGEFPEYHSSADNMELIRGESLAGSVDLLVQIVEGIESAERFINLKPECEPQLGRRGLFKSIGGQAETKDFQMALLWVLSLSDGKHSLEDIAERSGLGVAILRTAVNELLKTDLLARAD